MSGRARVALLAMVILVASWVVGVALAVLVLGREGSTVSW